ncbi:hypothetical protein ACQ4PT_059859 [Festuca glaucescens]
MAAPCKSTAMVDRKFYAPHQTAFTLTKSHTWNGSEFLVRSSADGAPVIQVETAHIGYRNLRSLRFLDAASRRPVMAVEELGKGLVRRWEAFRGDGTSGSGDRLFVIVDKSRFFHKGLTLHVFLDGNSSGDRNPDFAVDSSCNGGPMTISRGGGGDSHDKDIAKIERKTTPAKNACTVLVEPGVDQAFVLALTVVVDQIYNHYNCACRCNHTCTRARIQRH